jgi:hypothetical protein
MSDVSIRFRHRAAECRTLAVAAKDDFQRNLLLEMADELEAEAARIEAEEGPDMQLPPVGT